MGNLAVGVCVSWVALSLLPALGGCVVEPGVVAPANGIAVGGPPPQPVNEPRPEPAKSERPETWVGGYWHWTGMQYTWIPGHWENAPPGAWWRAPRYSLRDGTYFYEPGGWSRGR
jgi:hypothetical protein